jgi:CheY-like chemotaxis protein
MLTAEDSRSCLMMAGHCEPDMFLLDVSMPGEDGWTLARKLREGGEAARAHRDGFRERPRGA